MNFNEIIEATKSLLNPGKAESYFSSQLPKAGWGPAIFNHGVVLGVNLILMVFRLIISVALVGLIGTALGGLFGSALAGTSLMTGAINTVLAFVASIVLLFVLSGFLYLLSKLFGGKGTFVQQFYLQSVIGIGLLPVTLILTIIGWIPCVSCLILPVFVIYALYSLYLLYLSLKISHSLDGSKAIMVIVVYFIAIFVLVGLIVLALIIFNLGATIGLGSLSRLIGR